MRRLVYLHGFASSARSTKASDFGRRATAAGWSFECPDLNLPDFETLTITRMLDQVDDLVAAGGAPTTLVGSSLGALIAVEAARRHAATRDVSRVDSLVLLAPALDLVAGLERTFGTAGLAAWEQRGVHDVFHYGDGRMRLLRWAFMADARRYDPMSAVIDLPLLVYQGRRDVVVDPRPVVAWTAKQPHATLHLLDDDHQLAASLDTMWEGTRAFVDGLPA